MTSSLEDDPAMRPASVVRTQIGESSLPRVILGDHGFLAKFGSTMTDAEVETRMVEALSFAALGIAAGEARCGYAAARACRTAGRDTRSTVVHHDDVPLLLGGEPIRYRKCASTLLALLSSHGCDISQDLVLGFLTQWATSEALTGADLCSLQTAPELPANSPAATVAAGAPAVVTIGGDWLDLLMLAELYDLAAQAFSLVAARARRAGAAVALTSYVGGLCPPAATAPLLTLSDAILIPFNRAGHGMVPDPNASLGWATSHGLPVLGMHLMAGETDISHALSACAAADIKVAIVGASQKRHIRLLADAAAELPGNPS